MSQLKGLQGFNTTGRTSSSSLSWCLKTGATFCTEALHGWIHVSTEDDFKIHDFGLSAIDAAFNVDTTTAKRGVAVLLSAQDRNGPLRLVRQIPMTAEAFSQWSHWVCLADNQSFIVDEQGKFWLTFNENTKFNLFAHPLQPGSALEILKFTFTSYSAEKAKMLSKDDLQKLQEVWGQKVKELYTKVDTAINEVATGGKPSSTPATDPTMSLEGKLLYAQKAIGQGKLKGVHIHDQETSKLALPAESLGSLEAYVARRRREESGELDLEKEALPPPPSWFSQRSH